MTRWRWILLAGLLLGGCTPDAYQRSADLQVEQLVRDRKKQTLGYDPKTVAAVETPSEPTQKSYASIPATPIPPPALPSIDYDRYQLSFGPLGPEMLFPSGAVSPMHEPMSPEVARQPALERLRLGPPADRVNIATLDIFQAVEYAVGHSRDYRNRMEDVYLAALRVTLQRHLFEPRPFANTSLQYAGAQADRQRDPSASYQSALSIINTAGIRQQLPLGGEVVARGIVNFVNSLNENVSDGESAQLALTASIPLLRGAGMVNLENLIQSERSLIYAIRDFESFRRSFAVDIATQYFRLMTSQQSIANRRFNYIVLAGVTEQTEALYGAGRLNYLEVLRALQAQVSAENSLLDAIDSYQSDLDRFKQAIGMPVEDPLEVIPVELDITTPNLEADVTDLALRYRLDLRTAEDQIEDARRIVANSRNSLLPDVTLNGGGTIGNRTDTPARQIDARDLSYTAGLNIDLPLDRVQERNDYRTALIDLEQAQRRFANTREAIIAQVRDDVRTIRSKKSTVEIQRRGIDLARRRFDFANELLVLGRATDSRDVVDAQSDLLDAQDRYDQARADLQIQILQFLENTGTLRLDPTAGSLGVAMNPVETRR